MKVFYPWIKELTGIKQDSRELAEVLNQFVFDPELTANPQVLEVKVQANRVADASGHLGFSQEVARILKTKVREPKVVYKKSSVTAKDKLEVLLKDSKLCRRYSAAYLENAKIGASPKWLQEKLLACGLRPINAAVDVMNYVMLEYGQPLHAFDFDKLHPAGAKAQIIVRRAKPGEKITSLEDKHYDLNGTELLICDLEQPLALAGIKGGKVAEISKSTKRIVIEAANFEPVSIRLTAKRLGLKTDASLRFSHNLSPELCPLGMIRALSLLKEIAGAKIYEPIDVYPKKQTKEDIGLDLKKINRIIGAELNLKEVLDVLEKLGFKKKGNKLEVDAVLNPAFLYSRERVNNFGGNSFLEEGKGLRINGSVALPRLLFNGENFAWGLYGDFDLEALLMGKVIKKSPVPEGMFN